MEDVVKVALARRAFIVRRGPASYNRKKGRLLDLYSWEIVIGREIENALPKGSADWEMGLWRFGNCQ